MNDPSRILVRCPNWVGDLVMATPALRALRGRFPRAEITLLLKPALAEIVAGAPWHDRVVPLRTYGSDAAPGALLRAAAALRRERHDLAVLLPNSFSAAWLAKLARIPRILGYARNARSWLLTERVPPPRERGRIVPVPMTRYYLDLVAPLGCDTSRIDPELHVTAEEEAQAGAALRGIGIDGARPLHLLMPGASFGSSKMWPPDRFARAADTLLERHGGAAAIFPGPGEVETAERVAKAMRARAAVAPVVGLGALKAAVRRADLVLTNDAGARHLAAAFRVPHVIVMGPTDPRYTDMNLEHAVVVRRDVPCGPCHLKICPLDHRCMTLIRPEDVVEAAERALATRARETSGGSVVLDRGDLARRLAEHQRAGRKVVFTNGCFDLVHVGHVRLLAGAGAEGDVLVVGLNDDASVRRLKGPGRPVQPERERAELVAALRGVDYVTIFPEDTVDAILRALRPDVYAKGTDYSLDTLPERPTAEALGARIAFVGDPKEHATRDLIARIRQRLESARAGGADLREREGAAPGKARAGERS